MKDAPKTRDASTVIVLRDAVGGPEVFLVRRNRRASFMANAYVYPGGALDPEDQDLALEAHTHGLTPAEAVTRLGEETSPTHAFGLFLAGVRETFEEAGFLLARAHDADHYIDLDTGRFEQLRASMRAGDIGLLDLAITESLRYDLSSMHLFARWITPYFETRRFDARFFLVEAPAHQTPVHDAEETVASEWMRPADAIDAYHRQELLLSPPTLATLSQLSHFDTVASAQAFAAGHQPAICLPHFFMGEDQRTILTLPGDPEYPVDDPAYIQDSPPHDIPRITMDAEGLWRI